MTELKDYASYLPPILGSIGAMLPLLIYTAVTDDFKDRTRMPLCLSLFFLLAWLGYLLTVDIAACFGYSTSYTYVCLCGAVLTLVALMWLQTKRDGNDGGRFIQWCRRNYLRVLMVVYIVLILCVTSAASNFLARSKVVIYRFDVRNQRRIQSASIELKADKDAAPSTFSVTAIHPWFSSIYFVAVPKQTIDTSVTPPKFSLDLAPLAAGEKNPKLVEKNTMQPNLADWVFGDSYTYTIE